MKTNILPCLLFTVFILFSCQKLELEHIIKIVSLPAANVTSTTVTLSGNIIDPGENISECGHVWWISGSSAESKITNAAKTGNFSDTLTGLQPVTKYLFKAYATDRNGTVFGDTLDFITAGISPIAAFTASSTNVTTGESIQFTDQSTNTPTGWSWNFGDGGTSTLQNPSHTYLTAGSYTVILTASNSFGSDDEIKSNYITVNASGSAPVAAFTASSTNITTGESIQFTDQSTNTPTLWNWNFGDGNASSLQNPLHAYSTAGSYTVTLTAYNGFGYDVEIKSDYITVVAGEIFTDSRDGNSYYWLQIGSQVWMAENLAYLPSVSPSSAGSGTAQYFYVYGYEGTSVSAAKATVNYTTYGVLYNWPAAMNGASSSSSNPSGVQGVCPSGWHLPGYAELTQLTDYLGGASVAGGKLKEAGYDHWLSPNEGATNSSGFTALPGGYVHGGGFFISVGNQGFWWSATESDASDAWFRGLDYDRASVGLASYYKYGGTSVRCVRDY
jgi:uncharacterized protein (TIGR02145 family)